MTMLPWRKGDRSNSPERPEPCCAQIGPVPFSHDCTELTRLLGQLADEQLSEAGRARLLGLLRDDPAACDYYLDYMELHARLQWNQIHREEPVAPASAPSFPPIVIEPLSGASFSAVPSFVGSVLFSYLTAAVLLGIGLLAADCWKTSPREEFVRQSLPISPRLHERGPATEIVGRITGMVDCQLDQSQAQDLRRTTVVSLGDRFVLTSGLMEITYEAGARVILQGPVTYETASNGGYLSLGKLTGKLETKTQDPRPKTADSSSFAIRTPTATITDLGTEFGVEVSEEGHTTSHVFRGLVRFQIASGDRTSADSVRILRAGESAAAGRHEGRRTIAILPSAKAVSFVREIPRQTMKSLDLVDVVAGGDGFSGRRNRGIDPSSGRVIDLLPENPDAMPASDGQYHRVAGLPFVDGVFVPAGRYRPVQVDSFGHTFADCPDADGGTSGVFWAGGKGTFNPRFPSQNKLGEIDYATGKHGFLFLHANKGLTFNLDAIRRANAGYRPARFHATVGNTESASEQGEPVSADVWVLVDGQARCHYRQISRWNGALPVRVPIADKDRFLTLAATDGGDTIRYDWILFGDPRLELVFTPNGKGLNTQPK